MSELARFPIADRIVISAPQSAAAIIEEIWSQDRYRIRDLIGPGSRVVDIGANIGAFTLLAASRGADVFAFEPNPEAFAILERNIIENGFAGRVRAYNWAVAGHSGTIALSVPDSAKLYSLGSATTSSANREHLAGLSEVNLRTFPVRCVTLGEFLSFPETGGGGIGFLKIDCEGAEWEILGTLAPETAAGIAHLSMETHDGYGEKAMVDRVRKAGFAITGFTPRSGHFRTGYLYASRADGLPPPRPALGAIARLEAPRYARVGDALFADAGASFSLGSGAPIFRWLLDGAYAGAGPVTRIPADSPGVRRLTLEFTDGESTSLATARIPVLARDYSDPAEGEVDLPQGARLRIDGGDMSLRIPAASLPGTWEIAGVVLSFSFPPRPPGAAMTPMVIANGSTFPVTGDYAEVRLDFPVNGLDIRFRAVSIPGTGCDIGWWPFGSDTAPAAVGDRSDGEAVSLPPSGVPFQYRHEGKRSFRIGGGLLPSEWTPKAVKLGVAALPGAAGNSPLSGSIRQRNLQQHLTGWYCESVLEIGDPKGPVEFEMVTERDGDLKLVWWAE